jgi:hypothetical protein
MGVTSGPLVNHVTRPAIVKHVTHAPIRKHVTHASIFNQIMGFLGEGAQRLFMNAATARPVDFKIP